MSSPVIFHADLDAFYASVEQRDNPEHAGKPVIVGAAPGRRGVVSACSYEARAFGVHSAMPISEAYRLCPHGVYLPVRMGRYVAVSSQVMAILASWTPALNQISVDEAFLDMTGTKRLLGAPHAVARRIKDQVKRDLGLVVSIGVGPSKFVAKIASDVGKPDGLTVVPHEGVAEFVAGMPLRKLWGLGAKTIQRLADFGIESVVDLRRIDRERLQALFGTAAAAYLKAVSHGEDPGIYTGVTKSRSFSGERTFEHDTADNEVITHRLLEIAHTVSHRLIKQGARGKTVVLKLRTENFETHTARQTLDHAIRSAEELYNTGLALLSKSWDGKRRVRLVGLGISHVLTDGSLSQGELFESVDDKRRRVEETIVAGGFHLKKAALLPRNDPSAIRPES